jgi:hypothetical protein
MTPRADQIASEPVVFPPPPREIRRKLGRGCATSFTQLFILPHILIGIGSIVFLIGDAGLLAFGTSTPATVTKREMQTSRKGHTSYYVDYTYLADGKSYTERIGVSAERYGQLSPGATLAVKSFHIGNLGTSVVVDPIGVALKSLGMLFVWSAFWNGIVSIFFWQLYVLPLRRRWLAKNGQAIWGKIVWKDTRSVKGGKTYYLRYAYYFASGIHNTSEFAVSRREYDGAEIDQKVLVLYSPQKPKLSILYGFGDYFALDAYGREIKLPA